MFDQKIVNELSVWASIAEILGLVALILSGLFLVYKKWAFLKLLWKKLKLFIFPVSFNLAFSMESGEGLNTGVYYKEIKSKFHELLVLKNLLTSIKVHDFSDIKKFNNQEEAEKFRTQKQIDLIVWGKFSDDRLKEHGQSVSDIEIHFTFGHPEDEDRKIGKILINDISSKFATRNYWRIVDDESKKDTSVVSNNIFDVSTYILGTTLMLYGKIGESLKIFLGLYDSLSDRGDSFVRFVKPYIFQCRRLLLIESYYGKKDLDSASKHAEGILEIYPNDYFALANLALISYKLKNKERAQQLIETLYHKYPLMPLTELNSAFLCILKKDYSAALKHYKTFLNFDQIDFNPNEVVEFLGEEYKVAGDPAMLFGSAIVSMRYSDQDLAVADFKRFIKLAQKNPALNGMYRTAERLLRQLENRLKVN